MTCACCVCVPSRLQALCGVQMPSSWLQCTRRPAFYPQIQVLFSLMDTRQLKEVVRFVGWLLACFLTCLRGSLPSVTEGQRAGHVRAMFSDKQTSCAAAELSQTSG